MIIQCINCNKKFEVNSSLIPDDGRDIQCGSCNYIWLYRPSNNRLKTEIKVLDEEKINSDNKIETNLNYKDEIFVDNEKESKKIEYSQTTKSQKSFSYYLGRILSFIIVGIISFVALIVILDTFKLPLTNVFPGLELLLYNLFETIKDIFLFNKNLFL